MNPEKASRLSARFIESGTEWARLSRRDELERFLARSGQESPPFDAVSEGERAFTLADGIILETGTLILSGARPGARRAAYLAETHFALVDERALYETLKDFLAEAGPAWRDRAGPALTLITGPSRTADIEKTLVMGAHGPRKLVVATAPEALIRELFSGAKR